MGNQIPGLRSRSTREEILFELTASSEKDNVVGIFLSGNDEMLTTSVLKIEDVAGDDKKVYVRNMDLHGYPISTNPILLSGIKSLIPFKTLFNDPVYVSIRERRNRQSDDLAA